MSQAMLESSDRARRTTRPRSSDEEPPTTALNPHASPATVDEAPPAAGNPGGEGLLSKSFVGLLITQFLGAMNDNMFRWLIVPIGKDMVETENQGIVVAVGAVVLVLPFILFAAPAAYFADRFSKRHVIVGCKIAEIILMLAGMAAILFGNIYVMFGVLFLMGIHSTIFSPAKYGSIPEIVRADRIPAANGWMGMLTILAIVLGTVAGGYLYWWTRPFGTSQWWMWAVAIIGTASLGFAASLLIKRLPAANPTLACPWNIVKVTIRDVGTLGRARPLFLAALGTAMFWSLGGLCQVNIDRIVTADFGLTQPDVGPLLGILCLGVGVGNVVAGLVSAGRIMLGLVPVAGGGIAAAALLLATVPVGADSHGYVISAMWLFVLGLSAGMYDVPLQAFLQHRSPIKSRGSILAASNFMTFSGMLLASGVFMLLSGPLALSGRTISLIAGVAFVPVVIAAVWIIPAETVRFLVWIMSRLMYRVRVEGLENVPKEGGALLVSNHVSWADGPLLALSLTRDIRMVVYAEYFEKPWLRWFGNLAEVIPIQPGKRQVVESIRAARTALRDDELVGIFPEGGITRTGELQPFQAGFLAILKDTGKPVVPIHIEGMWGSIFSFERGKFFWKWPRRWPYPLTIRFGRPIENPTDPEAVRAAVLALQEKDGAGRTA